MEREISLSSYSVKDEPGNRPGDFTTRFSRTLDYEHSDGIWYIGFNKIISMAFTWTNINPGYDNQKIAYSKDGGKTFTDIDFPKGVWDYIDIDNYIKEKTKKIVYDTDNLHLVTFAKNLLEYSDDFGRSTAKNSLWYLDTDATSDDTNTGLESRRLLTANRAHVNTSIPLNRYSFFEELEGRLLPPMDLQFEIELTPDAEVLYGAVDTLRLVIDRFYLWVPRLEPKDALMSKFISEYQKPSKWKYLKEMYQSSDTTRNSGDFRISASIDKVNHVFLYFQRLKTNDMSANPYIFDTFKLNAANNNSHLTTCRLEYGNGVFYPELEYDTESKTRIYYDLMNYSWKKNDYNTGTQLHISNFSRLYPMLYFDLTYQTEQVSRDPKQLNIRFRLSQAAAADFRVHAIVLYEEDVVVDKVGDQLVIV